MQSGAQNAGQGKAKASRRPSTVCSAVLQSPRKAGSRKAPQLPVAASSGLDVSSVRQGTEQTGVLGRSPVESSLAREVGSGSFQVVHPLAAILHLTDSLCASLPRVPTTLAQLASKVVGLVALHHSFDADSSPMLGAM